MKRIIGVLALIAVITALLAGCSYNLDFNLGEITGSTSQAGETSIDCSDLEKLMVDVGVGNITISKSSDQNAEIKYKKIIKGNSEYIKEVADNILVVTEAVDDKLVVEVKSNNGDSKDFWQWLSKKYKNINVSVDVDIKIPENIEILNVNDGVGDIDIKDLKGEYNVVSGVGRIKMKDVSFKDKCVVTAGTGDIDIDCDIEDSENLSVQSGVGDINISMSKDAKFDLDAVAGVGSIKGSLITPNKEAFVGDTLKQKVNEGGTKLEVTAGTGSITINKK